MPDLDDEKYIIRDLIRGDAAAFDKIYSRYNGKVYAFSLKNLKSKEDAKGVVQEVFFSLWEERLKLKEVKNLDAWIFTVSFNIIRKRFRQLVRARQHLRKFAEIALSEDNSTVTNIEYSDLLDKANSIVDQLPERQKIVYNLRKKRGFTNEEIARELKITKKTVENHLSKAKAFIKKALVDEHLISLLFFWLFIR